MEGQFSYFYYNIQAIARSIQFVDSSADRLIIPNYLNYQKILTFQFSPAKLFLNNKNQ
ncbi:hypothetical protein BMMGA3_02770 [Bacillus methanolicus MGA3]|uniref:Uncharacterized protein n=1 Tax=Bacillus methanolicus (strain MGA3 / ATCC 53907) TaxID=796606 RepID=A0A068LPY7_BACMM|nr:hypothetical protein BMMGA3_02770 [Bacillus methanolicus MGA3]